MWERKGLGRKVLPTPTNCVGGGESMKVNLPTGMEGGGGGRNGDHVEGGMLYHILNNRMSPPIGEALEVLKGL